jgi:hypothetical protein
MKTTSRDLTQSHEFALDTHVEDQDVYGDPLCDSDVEENVILQYFDTDDETFFELNNAPIDPIAEIREIQALSKGNVFFARAKYLRAPNELRSEFDALADRWERETLVVSSPSEAARHPAYYRMIGLGLQAVPLILERLRTDHKYWFWALAAITGEDPASDSETIPAAVEAWVDWGSRSGYLSGE